MTLPQAYKYLQIAIPEKLEDHVEITHSVSSLPDPVVTARFSDGTVQHTTRAARLADALEQLADGFLPNGYVAYERIKRGIGGHPHTGYSMRQGVQTWECMIVDPTDTALAVVAGYESERDAMVAAIKQHCRTTEVSLDGVTFESNHRLIEYTTPSGRAGCTVIDRATEKVLCGVLETTPRRARYEAYQRLFEGGQ